MKNPLVSIGVTSYNRPKTLIRTINSLINQTYTNLEIIVSDNCSPNNEVEAVMNHFGSDLRIKYYRQSTNKGPFFNYNFVLEMASGDYFMRLADDDWIDYNYIEACLGFLMVNPEYTAAYGVAKLYNLQNEYFKDDTKIDLMQSSGVERIKSYFKQVSHNSCYYGLVNKSYKPVLKSQKLLADDWLIVARLAFLGKYKMLENTNCYMSAGGVSQSIEHLTTTLKMPFYTKYYFYLTISLNVFNDIYLYSLIYRSIDIIKRLKLAFECFLIIYLRFHVTSELKSGSKKIIKLIFNKIS